MAKAYHSYFTKSTYLITYNDSDYNSPHRARSLYSMVKESSDMTKRVPTWKKKNRFFQLFFYFSLRHDYFSFFPFLFITLTSIDSDEITVSQNTFTISTRYAKTLTQQPIKRKLNSRLCRINHENKEFLSLSLFLFFSFFFLLQHTTIWDFFLSNKDKIIFLFLFSLTCQNHPCLDRLTIEYECAPI